MKGSWQRPSARPPLTARLLSIPEYRELFHAAYPDMAEEDLDEGQLPPLFRQALRDEPEVIGMVLSTLDPLVAERQELTTEEFAQLLAFLHSLTSPTAVDLSGLVPQSVPSGLPVWD